MSSRGKRVRQRRLLRLQDGLVAQRKRLDQFETELAAKIATKITIYLDTNHWVNLRHVFLQRPTAKPEYGEALTLLQSLVSHGIACCPVSSSIFEELMKQSDLDTRRATAKLMDTLSGGVCLQFLLKLARREWRHNVWQVVLGAPALRSFPVWTGAGFWAAQDDLLRDISFWVDKPEGSIAAWVDLTWSMGFEAAQGIPDFTPVPDSMIDDFVALMNDAHERAKAALASFDEIRRRVKVDLLDALKDDFFNEPLPDPKPDMLPTTIFSAFVDEHDPWILPPLQIYASVAAAVMKSNRVVRRNDALDFTHAASAIPYCSAFFCDNPMKHFLTCAPLALDKAYGTRILGSPDEMLAYLKQIG
jgi:hypothetical protein